MSRADRFHIYGQRKTLARLDNHRCVLMSHLQAKYAYRSIAEFVKHATQQPAEDLGHNPSPGHHIPFSNVDNTSSSSEHQGPPKSKFSRLSFWRANHLTSSEGSGRGAELSEKNNEGARKEASKSIAVKTDGSVDEGHGCTSASGCVSGISRESRLFH